MSDYLDLTDLLENEEAPEPFRFQVQGAKFEVSTDMKPAQRKMLFKAQNEENMEAMLSAIFGDELPRLDELNLSLAQLFVIVNAWNKFLADQGGMDMGEESASTAPVVSTGKPSGRTLRTTSRR